MSPEQSKDCREDSCGPSGGRCRGVDSFSLACRTRNVITRLKDLKDSGDMIDIYDLPRHRFFFVIQYQLSDLRY